MRPRTANNLRYLHTLVGEMRFKLKGEALDEYVHWRLTEPKLVGATGKDDPMAQRQWHIECRADFDDQDKNELINEIMRAAALQVLGNLDLLKVGKDQQPQVVCYSDDFFHTRQDLDLFVKEGDTPLQTAIEQYAARMTKIEVSDELLAAVQADVQNKTA